MSISHCLFVSMLDWSVEEEDPEVSVFTLRLVMSLIRIIPSKALVSLSSVVSLNMSVNRTTHVILFSNFIGIFSSYIVGLLISSQVKLLLRGACILGRTV